MRKRNEGTGQTTESRKEKKLVLRRQTLRNVTPAELKMVQGGKEPDKSSALCHDTDTNGHA